MPGSSPTMARRDPVRWLKSVDLPTLGRPTMATSGSGFFLLKGFSCSCCFLAALFCYASFSRYGEEFSSRYYRDSVPSSSHPESSPATRAAGFSLYQFFAPGGVLSKTHPGYEFRRGQLQMAQAVEEALEEKRHLIVEAGTGTGKTLAYLLPVIRSGKRVIIS